MAKNKERLNEVMSLEEKEEEILKSKKVLERTKSNPIEIAKVKIELHDKFNTVFFLSPSKTNNQAYVDSLIQRVKNQY